MHAVRLECRRGMAGVALAVVIARSLAAAMQKGCPGRMGVDGKIGAGAALSARSPGSAIRNEVGTDRRNRVRCWIEEICQRKKAAGREERNEKHNRDGNRKPSRMKQREQEHTQLVACHGSPVDHSVEMARGCAPSAGNYQKIERDGRNGAADEDSVCLRGEMVPAQAKED